MKATTPPRLLVAVATACLVLPSCKRTAEAKADPEWRRLEIERIEAAHQVELLELRLASRETGDDDFAGLLAEVEHGDTCRRELALERDGLRQDIEGTRGALEAARAEWMRAARAAAAGREFANFTGARGRTYENAVITRVTDVGVEFRHATGTARLAAADLTPAQHELFGLDADIAREAIRQEEAAALAYGQWIDGQVAVVEAAQKEESERLAVAAAATERQARTVSRVAVAPEKPFTQSRLTAPARSFGRSRSTVWYSSYYYRPYYRSYTSSCSPYPARYRPSASIFYDPATGGAPARVNATPRYRPPGTPATRTFPANTCPPSLVPTP